MRHAWRQRELIVELERVTQQLSHLPSRDTMKVWGDEPPSAYDQVFGSFKQALEYVDDPGSVDERPSRQELLQELQRIAFERNGLVKRYHLYTESRFSPGDYDREFGSVTEALIKTGLIQREAELNHHHSDRDVIADIQRVDYQVAGVLTVREYLDQGEYSYEVIRNKWGTWSQALVACDLISSEEDHKPSQDALVKDIKRVGEELDGQPTRDEYVEYGAYSIVEINKSVGWRVLLALAGYDPPNRGRTIGEDDLVAEFQRVATKLGHRPTRQEMRDFGRYTERPYERVYGDWKTARSEIRLPNSE